MSTAAVNAIETSALYKRYDGGVTALAGVDLAVPQGVIYALLGPNGAGKTTMTSILATTARPSSGAARVAGFDVQRQAAQVRRRIGVTFQEMVLDDDLTGRQVLDYHARLYAMDGRERAARTAELLDLVQLREAADRRVRGYSGGMKRRLELARALMTRPQVLFLDEPTLGIDPQTRARIWQYVRDLKQRHGMTLLLTTHYMDEAEELADLVGIIDHGRIVAEGAPRDLISRVSADAVRGEGAPRPSNLEDVFFSFTGTMLREKQEEGT